MLTVGIVGLPNVGKSTLFNALTRTRQAPVASYPFCTIDPNVGVIEVPGERLDRLVPIYHTDKKIPWPTLTRRMQFYLAQSSQQNLRWKGLQGT